MVVRYGKLLQKQLESDRRRLERQWPFVKTILNFLNKLRKEKFRQPTLHGEFAKPKDKNEISMAKKRGLTQKPRFGR